MKYNKMLKGRKLGMQFLIIRCLVRRVIRMLAMFQLDDCKGLRPIRQGKGSGLGAVMDKFEH